MINIEELSLERKKKVLHAYEEINKTREDDFNLKKLIYLCKEASDEELDFIIRKLECGFMLRQAIFLYKLSIIRKNDYTTNILVEDCLKDGMKVDYLDFLLKKDSTFSCEQVRELLKVINSWEHFRISNNLKNLLIDSRLPAFAIKYLCETEGKVDEQKIKSIIKVDFESLTEFSRNLILRAIVEDKFSDETVTTILQGKNEYEIGVIYDLVKSGLPAELCTKTLRDKCTNGKSAHNNKLTVMEALKEQVLISTIAEYTEKNKFDELAKITRQARTERENQKIEKNFKKLFEFYND